ncbi:MAG TPA: PKD domain-containing protein [Thermoanaerobaculaceae bacterium]|nr:PKD domain-containing protein [Thermoanaerobaculaceae bacterium]HRS15846.1 PKD domain-containing protein [Thermoanaerobaculaceae bacterium]
MKQLKVCLPLLPALVVLLAPSGAVPAAGQTCVQPSTPPSPPAYWASSAPPQTVYECSDLMFHNRIARVSGQAGQPGLPKLVSVVGCDVVFSDVSGASPVKETSIKLWNYGNNDTHSNHYLSGVEILDGFPYVMLSHSNNGWVMGKIQMSGSGAVSTLSYVTHFKFGDSRPSPDAQAYGTKMWWGNDGRAYIVGMYLDKNIDDAAFKIADLGTGEQTPPFTIKSALPSSSLSSMFSTMKVGSTIYLLQWGRNGLYVHNVTNPSVPQLAAVHTDTPFKFPTKDYGPDYVWGPVVLNRGTDNAPQWRAYTYQRGGSKLYIIDLNNPLAPVVLAQATLPDGAASINSVASDGQLLVAHRLTPSSETLPGPQLTYYSVVDDSFQEIPSHFWWDKGRDRLGEEFAQEIAVWPGAGQYKVFAAARIRAYQSTVQASCLSMTPTAALGVARASGQTGTPGCTPGHPEAAKGFPGDVFTLTNGSTNGLLLESLEVRHPDQSVHDLTAQFGSGSMSWTSPAAGPLGEYTFTLRMRDAQQVLYTAQAYVQLCGDPTARLAITHVRAPGGNWAACTSCSWLAGYGVRLSAAGSDGHPVWSGSNPTWDVQYRPKDGSWSPAPETDYVNPGDGTLELTLNGIGDYKVGASVSYPYEELPVGTGDTTLHSGAVTAAFTAYQGGTQVVNNGTADRAKATALTFTGQPASGSTCVWAIAPAHWGGFSGACGSAASIPAGTLQKDQQYTLTLTASVSEPVADEAVATLVFTATEITGDFSWSPTTPNIGQTTTFTPLNLPTGVKRLRWEFGEEGCDPQAHPATLEVPCLAGCVAATFQFKTGGSKTVTLSASTDSVNFTPVATHSLTVNYAGSCVTCTPPSAPTNVVPQPGAQVGSGTVQFSWNPSTGTAPISYQVYLGPVAACSSSSTSCSTTISSPGTYSWTVRASNSCGNATSSATSFTVVSSGTAPSAPVLVSPANNANLPGGSVTFSWAASSGSQPITYDVNLGPLMKICSNVSGTTCSATISNASTYTWWVTAKNAAGSAQSETRTLVIGTPCVAPAAPTNPTPANGGVVAPGSVTLKWSAPASGTAPFTYDVYLGPTKACSDLTTTQCVVNNVQTGSFSWYVKAKNACSTGGVQSATWSFSVCQATAVPVVDFTWTPREPVTIGGVVQEQPYVGQTVTFDPSATTNYPTGWDWTDFNTPVPWIHYTVQNPTHVWNTPGDKIVRLTATNCIGSSQQVAKTVKVYPDIRPVTATFTVTATDPNRPQEVTFTAATGVDQGEPNEFTWDFGDGTTASGADKATVVHSYKCGATYPVKLTARRIKSGSTIVSSPSTQQVRVGGTLCSPQSLLVVDVARNLPGKNGALWNTDLTVYNPTTEEMMLKMAVKRPDGSPREESRTFSLLPNETLSLEQILTYTQIDFQKASLWFYQADPINRGMKPLPVISARTHTGAVPPYDDFGQFVMVYPVYQATDRKLTLFITGLRHNGKTAQQAGQGFRTNLTIVEPAGGQWSADAVKLTLYSVDDPNFVKERQLWAAGRYAYWQKSIDEFFQDVAPEDDLGRIILKIEVEPGASIAFGCSLINNFTNAPIFVPTQTLE